MWGNNEIMKAETVLDKLAARNAVNMNYDCHNNIFETSQDSESWIVNESLSNQGM